MFHGKLISFIWLISNNIMYKSPNLLISPQHIQINQIQVLSLEKCVSDLIKPAGFEKNFILFFIIEISVGKLSVLGSQEVEHVEGRFPVRLDAVTGDE